MASSSSKAIPFVALAVALICIGVQVMTGKDVLTPALPLLTSVGLAGVPLSIVKNAVEAKKAVDIAKIQAAIGSDSSSSGPTETPTPSTGGSTPATS